ncbi:---NA--- [Octopus vulgaris]|uniref:---NA n=1 Tax=Octopus vulgaris TaxID=6645 RepID=A0AA36BQV9_OCTVU|nr:---NA--- [Octopus vulgaris]
MDQIQSKSIDFYMLKAYHCDVCKKSVSHKSAFILERSHITAASVLNHSLKKSLLTTHSHIHTGETPYHCDKSFSVSSALISHNVLTEGFYLFYTKDIKSKCFN